MAGPGVDAGLEVAPGGESQRSLGPAQYRLIDPEEIIRTVNSKNAWQLDEAAKKKYNL